jgi:hypothetical protein
MLGTRGSVVRGYDVPNQIRSDAVTLVNGNVVECVEPVEVPARSRSARVRAPWPERDTRP